MILSKSIIMILMMCGILLSQIVNAAVMQKPKIVKNPTVEYPPEAMALGHQGTVIVEVKIMADDTISDPVIKKSSRSELLDQAAIRTINKAKFVHGTDTENKPVDLTVNIPVSFRKDSIANLKQKSCGDFIVDYQWFTQTFPELKPSEMTLYNLTLGMLVIQLAAQNTNVDQKLDLAKRFGENYDKTYHDCESEPESKFLQTLLNNLQ